MRTKNKTLFLAVVVVAAVVLAGVTSTSAQDGRPLHLSGVINDYSPVSGNTTAWELHGPWSLTVDKETGKAHFSLSLTMGLSAVGQSTTTLQDITLAQHTHNISMDGTVTYNPTDCPAASATTPPYTARIEINSTGAGASVFANGNVPPFGQFSPLQVCIAGGNVEANQPYVTFSNITLVFTGGAATHFGAQAIHGVVSKVKAEDRDGWH
jgi:hypothetical protein